MSDIRNYLEHPGNWGTLDGRRGLLLAMLERLDENHEADTAHALALEREKAAAMVSARGDDAHDYIFQGPAEAGRLWDLAASIRNGDHWKDGA